MSHITAITSFCGRKDENVYQWFKGASQMACDVVCICHDLHGDDLLEQRIRECAKMFSVNVNIVKWGKFDLIKRGYCAMWNDCIEQVKTDWFCIMAADEFLEELGDALSVTDNSCEVVSFRFDPEPVRVPRLFRTAIGFRYKGLIHEECYTGEGRHWNTTRLKECSGLLKHRRADGDRGMQYVLLLKAFYNKDLRHGTNKWWFDSFVSSRFVVVESEARRYCKSIGIDLKSGVEPPMDWDFWRENYSKWPFNAHRLFYEFIYMNYPEQNHFDELKMSEFFDWVGRSVSVYEVGGWSGVAAVKMLSSHGFISRWDNHEICAPAVLYGEKHPRYFPKAIDSWPWQQEIPHSDVFVASHVLEHMTKDHVEQMISRGTSWEYAYIDCPLIDDEIKDWSKYGGTHILECSWNELSELMVKHGFKLKHKHKKVGFFARE